MFNDVAARLSTITQVIDAEFDEMPGLRLTRSQAQRLWRLSDVDCEQALDHLCESGRLTKDPTGRYFRRRLDY